MSTYPIKLYIKYKPNLIMVGLAMLCNFATLAWILWNIRPQKDLIFLHYNILFGVDYVGEWWRVFSLPIIGILIIVVNFLIGWFLFSKDKIVAIIMNIVSLFCQIFLLIAAALLVFLNV